jgi:hypothetical protein
MKLVIIESPFAADTKERSELHVRYARAALRDSLMRCEAPFASHLLYTQPGVLDDGDREERRIGITAGLEWGEWADLVAVYEDLGISPGMEQGIAAAHRRGARVESRRLDPAILAEIMGGKS